MNADSLVTILSNVGFPIAMSIFLIYFMQTELKEMRKSIENNTLTMQKLLDSLNDFNKSGD